MRSLLWKRSRRNGAQSKMVLPFSKRSVHLKISIGADCPFGYKGVMAADPFELNLRHLRALLAIAEKGSITAAAESVSLSQPALTQGLAKLERQFGYSMFERRAGGWCLRRWASSSSNARGQRSTIYPMPRRAFRPSFNFPSA
ncbi:helix-turn-helix domain-containing protein [Novosphingobium rhizosphaerae]|uniref:helix-turn-helix domain-containing protein n=1 Tax=Novosphingobium rhizosphaerae TaxID=1551649 RepID=UPI003D815E46